MLILVLFLVSVLSLPTDANLCYEDVDLDNVQQHSYDLPYSPLDDYWNVQRIKYNHPHPRPGKLPTHNFNLAFHVFGKFSGKTNDSVIKAGYYADGDELIYSVEVNCKDQTWKSYVPSNAELPPCLPPYLNCRRRVRRSSSPEDRVLYQQGTLNSWGHCVEGEDFDLIFKVKQPHQFTWMFNSENLQKGLKYMTVWRVILGVGQYVYRERSLQVPSPDRSKKGGAATAVRFKVESSGAAVITRFAFGRCIALPRNMPCNKAKLWLEVRSKAFNPLGLHVPILTVDCFPQAPSLYRTTQLLHPDEFSMPNSGWVCCVNMKTGRIWNEDKNNVTLTRENNCRELLIWRSYLKPFFCDAALDLDLIQKEMAKYDAEQNEA